jgi:hypothetical protein
MGFRTTLRFSRPQRHCRYIIKVAGLSVPPMNLMPNQSTGISGMNLAVSVMPFLSEVSIAGVIQDFTPGEVSVLLEEFVPVGHSVAVKFRNATFHGEVLYSHPKEGRYQTNIRIMDSAETGLRSTPRFSVKLSAQVFARNSSAPIPATIIDISGAGLGLELPFPLSVGEPVAVESEVNIAFGVVRHCREHVKNIFRAGVQLHHVIQKTDNTFGSCRTSGLFAKIMSLTGLFRRR